jgi:two-component system sensor histidine kinase LytS
MEEIIFSKVCVLVTAAFLLTLVPGFRRTERSILSMRDRGTALLVFLLLGLLEEVMFRETGWFNQRIVAVCAAGLIAGPSVGLLVGVIVTWLAVVYDGLPLGSIGVSMVAGGLVGGWLYWWRPQLAQRPWSGFLLTLAVSWLRDGLLFAFGADSPATGQSWQQAAVAPLIQGLGTALILAIIAQARQRDEQARATTSAEVRALQARMNPHFLFNALNSLAALATIAPREIPSAAGRLRHFLRANFDQQDRTFVPIAEELAVVRAYLDIEILRFGKRLKVEHAIDPGATDTVVPPFSLQPLVENAVQHGIQSSSNAGQLRIAVRAVEQWLEMSVTDDGKGVPASNVQTVFFAERSKAHALLLLRQRLHGLFGRSFDFTVTSEIGCGTTVTLRIPMRTPYEVVGRSLEHLVAETGELAHS